MKKKTALCLLLSLLAAAGGALSACGETAAAPSEQTAPTENSAAVTEAVTEPAEYVSTGKDYGGETVTVSAVDYYTTGNRGVWRAQDYCEVFSNGENGDALNDGIYRRMVLVQEELNVKLALYSVDSFDNLVNDFRKPVMAGESVFDIAMMASNRLPSLLGTQMLVDLNTIPGVDFSHTWWDQTAREELTLFGQMYAATGDISLYISYAPITYFFNKQVVETLDLENPYQLVRDGKWTLDKAIEMSRQTAADLNGDGVMNPLDDRYGMCLEAASMYYTVAGCGLRLTTHTDDGVQLAVSTDKTEAVTSKMQEFMNDANVNVSNGKIKLGYSNNFVELMLPMFKENRALFFNNQILVALNLRDMDANFGILPPPKADEQQKDYCCPINDFWGMFATVPVTNTRLELTGDVLEAMGYYGQQVLTPAFIETTVRGKSLRDGDSAEMMELIFANRVYDMGSFYDWGGVKSMFATIADSPNSKFSSTFAKSESKIQKAIDKTIAELEG